MTKNLKHRSITLTIKAAAPDGSFEGYASVFGVVDSYNDVVMPGAFAASLAEHKSKGTMPKLLWQHRPDEPIGRFVEMYEDGTGLYVKGQLLIGEDPLAARAHAHLRAGSIDGMSIGYALRDAEYDEDDRVLRLTEIDLWEVSIVTFPANEEARVSDVKSVRDLERFLRATGCCSRNEAKHMAGQFEPKPREAVEAIKRLTETIRG